MSARVLDGHERVAWIGYTTRYRDGSREFARAAVTLQASLARRHPERVVLVEPLERKADFVAAMQRLERRKVRIAALHFIGHSGMYGVMFGSTAWPEQLSPHEWRSLRIPFAAGAAAYFHACRSGRWFAPFFARTFGVRAFGHHGYTCFSLDPERFKPELRRRAPGAPLYVVSVPGRKTHGLLGSCRKYLLAPRAEPMLAYEPRARSGADYDAVADLYARAFRDIRLRRVEWRWLRTRLAATFRRRPPRVLDIGCGNGALLGALAPHLESGAGVDVSAKMIDVARTSAAARAPNSKLSFAVIDGPCLPFADRSFDVVTCFLSFRYLDWDPVLQEIRRVLAPGGRLLIVDMVEKVQTLTDAPLLAASLARHAVRRLRDRRFTADVAALTRHPAWRQVLSHNPIRALHEYVFYLQSRFPGQRVETLSVGRRSRLIAFDSGPLEPGTLPPLSYP